MILSLLDRFPSKWMLNILSKPNERRPYFTKPEHSHASEEHRDSAGEQTLHLLDVIDH